MPNHQREIARIVYGDLVSAHRKACRLAGDIFTTQVSKTYDCMVLNAYPKDTDLVQAEGSFVALKHLKQPLLREEGVYVITTAASEGIGHHGLFAPGGASYRTPRQIRRIGDRDLWVYAPGLSDDEIHSLYWTGYACFSDAESLCRALSTRFDNEADVGILPYAPMQQVVDRREQ